MLHLTEDLMLLSEAFVFIDMKGSRLWVAKL